MASFTNNYGSRQTAIVTEAIVMETVDVITPQSMPRYVHTDKAAWDTGAEVTIISLEVARALNLQPVGRAAVSGIGGYEEGGTFKINLALPNNDVIHNLTVISYDLPDYDLLIGMDVISKMDFLITNKENTVFSFRYPSEGKVELEG